MMNVIYKSDLILDGSLSRVFRCWSVSIAITGSWASRLRTVSKLVHMSKLSWDQKGRNDFRIEDWMKVISKWRENWARDEFLITANISHWGPIPGPLHRVIEYCRFSSARTRTRRLYGEWVHFDVFIVFQRLGYKKRRDQPSIKSGFVQL